MLSPSETARQLGISTKALRIYEERGLLRPMRTTAGWRAYGPDEIRRAREIVELRALGLTLAEVARVIGGDATALARALGQHEAALVAQANRLQSTLDNVRRHRAELESGTSPSATDYRRALELVQMPAIAFDLPWPWGGERFEMRGIKPVTYVVGPLGSGKTRLAMRLAEAIPGGRFLGLDRLDSDGTPYASRLDDDARLRTQCDSILLSLENNGATRSPALMALIAALCSGETPVVIDMVEQGLDHGTQLALSRHLRHRDHPARPLFLMTRSSAILDLTVAESGETIIYCPANHSPPLIVLPDPLCPGYEAVATCLAAPEVRARTLGVIAAWAARAES